MEIFPGFVSLSNTYSIHFLQRRTITINTVEHALEVEKSNRGGGTALLQDAYEGDLQTCRRIIQRHIAKLGYLFPKLFSISLQNVAS